MDTFPPFMRTFFCETIPNAGEHARLDAAETRHVVRVLRLRPGDPIRLVDGRGGCAAAEVAEITPDRREPAVTCRVLQRATWALPACQLRLLVAPPRAHLFGPLIQDAVALGVARISPIVCEHSVSRPDPTGGGPDHWRAEALAALKQSGNPFLPQVDAPQAFADALTSTPAPGLFGDVAQSMAPAATFFSTLADPATLALWIGPEGGFSAAERAGLLARGFTPVRLGTWILRVETAVAALLGFVMGTGGDAFHSHQRT